MSISHAVLQFVDRVRRVPGDANDPRLLGRLEKMAKDAWDGAIVALYAPIAPRTLEVFVNYPGQADESNRIDVPFPRAVQVVGVRPSIVVTSDNQLVVPTAEDLLCALDIDQQDYPTANDGATVSSGARFGQFVTLASLSTDRRFLGMKLTAPKPSVGVTYRWKQGSSVAAVYEDCHIGLAFYYRFL
jgi:hypothetical protein